MLGLVTLPIVVWFWLREDAPAPLHVYTSSAAHALVILNVISIGVLLALFGWFQLHIYRRMEPSQHRH